MEKLVDSCKMSDGVNGWDEKAAPGYFFFEMQRNPIFSGNDIKAVLFLLLLDSCDSGFVMMIEM